MPEIEATVKHAGALRPADVEGCIAGWIERLPLGAIARQRWFAGKGREVERCRPLDLVAIGGEEPAGWICLLEVRFADSTRDTYHLPLAWSRTEEEAGREPARQPAFRVLVESDNGRFSIHPPAPGEPFWAHLLGAWRRGEELPGRRGHILFALARSPGERTAQEGALGRAAGSRGAIVRPLDENQSNTSLVIDETSLLKIYRRVEPGPHPEVELCRFLDEETGFRGTPAVEGWMEYRGDDGRAWSMAMAQRFVAGGVDGWSALLGELRSAAEPAAGRWSLALPERLGELTADLHLALAACGPEPELASRAMSAEDIDALRRSALANLERAREATGSARPDIPDLLERAERRIRALEPRFPAGRCQRVHGDYHLGQIICRRDELYVVDFEGEPARPLEERRLPHSPLKDVAGMLRSFSYAAACAEAESGERSEERGRLASALAAWEGRARRGFLERYDSRIAAAACPADLLPSPGPRAALLAFFELDKAVYELLYELRNRPQLAFIPARGIEEALARGGA